MTNIKENRGTPNTQNGGKTGFWAHLLGNSVKDVSTTTTYLKGEEQKQVVNELDIAQSSLLGNVFNVKPVGLFLLVLCLVCLVVYLLSIYLAALVTQVIIIAINIAFVSIEVIIPVMLWVSCVRSYYKSTSWQVKNQNYNDKAMLAQTDLMKTKFNVYGSSNAKLENLQQIEINEERYLDIQETILKNANNNINTNVMIGFAMAAVATSVVLWNHSTIMGVRDKMIASYTSAPVAEQTVTAANSVKPIANPPQQASTDIASWFSIPDPYTKENIKINKERVSLLDGTAFIDKENQQKLRKDRYILSHAEILKQSNKGFADKIRAINNALPAFNHNGIEWQRGLIISGGGRTEERNKEVGGSKNSHHLLKNGKTGAFDISGNSFYIKHPETGQIKIMPMNKFTMDLIIGIGKKQGFDELIQYEDDNHLHLAYPEKQNK